MQKIYFKKALYLSMALLLFFISSCAPKHKEEKKDITEIKPTFISQTLDPYWYQGKAEITSYELEQARYGQYHKGNAILIFVTEDFSISKQVKLDNPSDSNDKTAVLKMNYSKKFNTGIYPYSMLLSCFTPTGNEVYAHPIKISTSIQEWCGHVFMQINQRANRYETEQFSYFESEGDKKLSLPLDWCEDEIFSQIRINPLKLPLNSFKIIPSTFFIRLKHQPLSATDANAQLIDISSELQSYEIEFPLLKRSLKIMFNKKAPYEIQSWEESYIDGTEQLITKAKLKKRILLDYWNKHNVEDFIYRKELELQN